MGFSNWLFNSPEKEIKRADELRATAVSEPGEVAVSELVDVCTSASNAQATRLAAKGIAAVAETRPGRLLSHLPDLVAATTPDGPAADHRARLAEALELIARAHPDAVAEYTAAIEASLEDEVVVGDPAQRSGIELSERKVEALCSLLVVVEAERARPELQELRGHAHPAVSDAARKAMRQLEPKPRI